MGAQQPPAAREDLGAPLPDDGSADLAERAEALEQAAELGRGRLDPALVANAHEVAAKVRARLRHGTDRTVVALAGPTGAGKSSLFNALIGADVSTPGVKRPTTSAAHAALWGGDEPRLLRWLDIQRRYLVDDYLVDDYLVDDHANGFGVSSIGASVDGDATADGDAIDDGGDDRRPAGDDLGGLIVIDLPDVDSVEVSNRQEAQRLIEVVDALIWVVDPQKYADEVIHDNISSLSHHAGVMRFALNKIDLIPEAERQAVVGDLVDRLRADGVPDPIVWPVSTEASSPYGLDEVKAGIGQVVASQRALVTRLSADLSAAATPLADDGRSVEVSPERIRDAAVDEVSAAAKSRELAAAVELQYRRQARRTTGWLPLEWVRRRRPSPVAQVVRPGSVDRLRVESALRNAAEAGADGLGAPWQQIVRREVIGRADDVADALRTRSVNVARHVGTPPRWWSFFAALQRLLLTCAVIGMAWLGVAAVAGGLGLDTEPLIIKVGPTPIPSALVIGGIGLGILFGLLARLPANVGGRRRARAVMREMRDESAQVLEREVVAPIQHVLADRVEVGRLVGIAAG